MSGSETTLTPVDRDVMTFERKWVQRLLQAGLGCSVLLLLAGSALHLASGVSLGQPLTPEQIFNVEIGVADRMLTTGILVLAFTPVLRVLALLFLWKRQRDWKFVGVAALVLATLAISVFLGGS